MISFLDNAFLPPGDPQTTNNHSRGLIIALDTTTMISKLVAEFPHPEGKYAPSRGNMQILANKNSWICWTHGSLQSEHTFNGKLILKARFKAQISSYRTFKFPWIGRTNYPPDVHAAVIDKNSQWYTIVHMSWNGATEVREWKVYHTNANGTARRLVATIPRRGFETSAWTEGYAESVVVEALDKDNVTLGVSNIFASLPPRNRSRSVAESSFHSNKEFALHDEVKSSVATFALGILLGCSVGALALRIVQCALTGSLGLYSAWWKQSLQMYDPLITESEEEDVELDMFDDEVKDRTSKVGERDVARAGSVKEPSKVKIERAPSQMFDVRRGVDLLINRDAQ